MDLTIQITFSKKRKIEEISPVEREYVNLEKDDEDLYKICEGCTCSICKGEEEVDEEDILNYTDFEQVPMFNRWLDD